jgi:Beta-lactamase superfamily domain
MDIQFHGANCITIASRHARVTIDDNLVDLGLRSSTKQGDIALFTGAHSAPAVSPRIVIDHPGEYEVSETSLYGIALRGHMDESGKKSTTAYKFIIDDVRFLVIGHVYPELSERELEAIGTVDVMFVPVGGNGYTTDAVGALKLIKKIEPKIVIPTHYDDAALSYPVPQQTLDQALHGLSMEPLETTEKLRVKAFDLPEGTHLIVINRT